MKVQSFSALGCGLADLTFKVLGLLSTLSLNPCQMLFIQLCLVMTYTTLDQRMRDHRFRRVMRRSLLAKRSQSDSLAWLSPRLRLQHLSLHGHLWRLKYRPALIGRMRERIRIERLIRRLVRHSTHMLLGWRWQVGKHNLLPGTGARHTSGLTSKNRNMNPRASSRLRNQRRTSILTVSTTQSRISFGTMFGLRVLHTTSVLVRFTPRVLTHWFSQTEIYRKVFHAIPDDTVTTWKQYMHFITYHERLTKTVSFSSRFVDSLMSY